MCNDPHNLHKKIVALSFLACNNSSAKKRTSKLHRKVTKTLQNIVSKSANSICLATYVQIVTSVTAVISQVFFKKINFDSQIRNSIPDLKIPLSCCTAQGR